MPENTPNLGIPKPLGNEYFNRTNFNQILDTIDQNAAEKETLDNHIAVGNAHGIGDKSTLLTTSKSSIVDALNELFTNANDGKTAVANAVTAKGVTASPADTFSTLATKIGQINTGKKFASGSVIIYGGTGSMVTVSGLTFKPSLIHVFGSDGSHIIYNALRSTLDYYTSYNGGNYIELANSGYVNNSSFSLNRGYSSGGNVTHTWVAVE
jgi:hypothetical protein